MIDTMAFLLVFFIPRFQTMFAEFGGTLPLLTRIIVGISDGLRGYGLILLLGVGLAGFLVRSWLVSAKGRRTWEGLILRLPTLGSLVAQFAMARFCRMLGTLLAAGVPLINGLNVARRSIGNQILVDAVSNSIDLVKEGKAEERIVRTGEEVSGARREIIDGVAPGETVAVSNVERLEQGTPVSVTEQHP